MFSVIIPLYNKQYSITNTLNSVLKQTFTDFEIVIVNDGSTDNSLAVVQEFKDDRIKIIDKPNGGVSSARNRGIKEATKEWITFLDGDDLWKENHLEILHHMIDEYPKDKVFCTSFIKSNQELPKSKDNSIIVIEDYFKEAIKGHFFWTSVVCLNQTVLKKVGNFNEKLSRGEDLDLWARIGKHYRFIKSKIITAIYVQDSENKLSFTKSQLDKSILSNISFKNLSKSQKQYFKKLVINKIKTSLLKKDFKTVVLLSYKYNINLL